MAPSTGLVAAVASTIYSWSPAPAALRLLHSAPLPSPSADDDDDERAFPLPAAAADAGRPALVKRATETDDAAEVSSQGTARQRSTERPEGGEADDDDDDDEGSGELLVGDGGADGLRRTSIDSADGVTTAARDAADGGDGGYGHDDEDDDDEDEDEDDDCVVLVQTPYHIVLRNYAVVPVLAVLAVAGVVLALTFGWPPSIHSTEPYPHRPMWRQALFGLAFQSLAHSLRIPLFTLLSLVLPARALPTAHTAVHTLALETLRFGALVLVVPRLGGDDPAWRWPDVWEQWAPFAGTAWFGLGWGVGEVCVGIWQGYRHLSYYKPVLPSHDHGVYLADEEMQLANGHRALDAQDEAYDDDSDDEDAGEHKDEHRLEEQVWELIAVQKREEVEELLGVPLPNIPSVISALWRLDSLFLALGITLILSALNARHEDDNDGQYLIPPHTLPLFAAVAVGHAAISIGWLVGIKTLGAPATTYASLLIALGAVVWGLLTWGALV